LVSWGDGQDDAIWLKYPDKKEHELKKVLNNAIKASLATGNTDS